MRGLIPLLVVLLWLSSSLHAEWLNFNAGCLEGSSPLIRHGVTTFDKITFDVELRGFNIEEVEHNQDDYIRVTRISNMNVMQEEGYPELPVVTCFVAVPDGVVLDHSSYASCADFLSDITIYPAPQINLVSENGMTFYQESFVKDQAAYSSSEWYPSVTAEISGEFRLRDQRVAVVNVYPVQFLASEDSIRVWSDIEVQIEFDESAPILSGSDLGPFERLIGDKLIGYTPDIAPLGTPSPGDVYRPLDLTIAPPETPDYVIIVAGGLDGSWIDNLAAHRAALNGFDVVIARGDDIFEQFRTIEPVLTANLIRDYTETLWGFGSSGDRPSYLILIGDHEEASCTTIGPWYLPTKVSNDVSFGYGNDEWYTYFDESREILSSFPDMIVGRLSTRNTDNLEDIIDLIKSYESEVIGTGSPNLQYRRYITRLAGKEHDGSGIDTWQPTSGWTDDLRNWMDYNWDNYYCGDGEDTWNVLPPNPDQSRMTSSDWVEACNTVFNRGSHTAFYSDHGDFHMFSAGMNWGPPAPDYFGVPDSTFDDIDVKILGSFPNHWHPFLLMLCCSAGTFNHTEYEHSNNPVYQSQCSEPTDGTPGYDFLPDCMAEDFVRNTDGGAIGVFAGSNSSFISFYGPMGRGILEAIYYKGNTKMGDAISAGRLSCLDRFWAGDHFARELAQFNLLGDPALDLGDRVKYRSMCDLIISPDDFSQNIYPTNPVSGGNGAVDLSVVVRNSGAISSRQFDVELTVEWEAISQTLSTTSTSGLAPGQEMLCKFEWTLPLGFEFGDKIRLTAVADPDELCADSWTANNAASLLVTFLDAYPNELNWPLQLISSVKSPPLLADLNGDGTLEIVVISGTRMMAISPIDQSTIWTAGDYEFLHSEGLGGFTVAASGDVCGDSGVEIVVDTKNELLILDGSDGTELYSFDHGRQTSNFVRAPHTVVLSDLFPETGKLEIALVCPEVNGGPQSLFIFSIARQTLVELDQEILYDCYNYSRNWTSSNNVTPDASDELILGSDWYESGVGYKSGMWVYDHVDFSQQSGFIETEIRTETANSGGIHAVGDIAGASDQIALSRLRTASDGQAWLFDSDDLSTYQVCAEPANPSNYIQCCVLADWDEFVTDLDRVIAPAENQCLAWDGLGNLAFGWNTTYGLPSSSAHNAPMPALANLVEEPGYETSEVIVGTRDGWINAYNANRAEVNVLGFPYQLPAEVVGGYVVADIDLDGKLELVFGTMDNYLHVWELGDCPVGYAPWPQTQHDAMRTGALQN